MSAENEKVCCNCRHYKRIHDDKYDVIHCWCEVGKVNLSYVTVMTGWCRHWSKERREEAGGRAMTKQEAIETIKLALSQVEWDYPLDYAAAFDMAISAMEKQDAPDTNVDTINRQAAIDAMCSACGYECDKSEFIYNAPQDEQVILCPEHYALTQLPSAQPEQRWIPCSERWPEDDAEVLVYLFDRPSPYIAWVCDGCWFTEDFQVEKENYPNAWMPLPEPYREEGEYAK